MTTQSLPISKTRKDIAISVLVSILIIAAAALTVYYTRPATAGHNPGLIMRQPRMTFVLLYAAMVGVTCFVFLKKEATGYISRPLAWGACVVMGIGLVAVYFLTDDKTKGWSYKALLFALTFTLSATVLCEIIIFYRKKMSEKSRQNIFHRIAFALVCAAFIAATGYFYTEKAVGGGAILDYGVKATPAPTVPNVSTSVPSDPSLSIPGLTETTLPVTTAPVSSNPAE